MVWYLCDMRTYMSKETYIYAKRPTYMQTDVHKIPIYERLTKETYTHEKKPANEPYIHNKKNQHQDGLTPVWHDDIYVKRDLHIRKETYKKYKSMRDWQKRPIHMQRNLQTSPIFTTKKTNTNMVWYLRDMTTYMLKETYRQRDQQKRHIHANRDLQKSLIHTQRHIHMQRHIQTSPVFTKKKEQQQHGSIPVWHDDIKRPTKETFKRGICVRKKTGTFVCQTLDLIYLCVMHTKRDLRERPMWTKRDQYICASQTWSNSFVRDVYEKRPAKETYKRDLQKRPMWTKRDQYICVSNTWSDTFVRDVYEKRPKK